MKKTQLLFNNKPLSYTTSGRGTPLVLLHGFGEDSTIWREQHHAFPNCQLILPDLPGSGDSEGGDDLGMETLAAAVAAVLRNEGLHDGVIMLGHSMGGYVALAFAACYPGILKAFGLVHSTAYADSAEKKETRKKGIESIRKGGAESFLRATIPNLYASETREKGKQLLEQHMEGAKRFSPAALIAYYESMMERPDRTGVLKETALPVLFLFGRHDTAVPIEDGLKQCHLPRLSYIHILENSGHMGMIEEPLTCNKVLNEFVFFVNEHRP